MLDMAGNGRRNGGAIGGCAGVCVDATHEIGAGQDVGVIAENDRVAMFAHGGVGVGDADDAIGAAFGFSAAPQDRGRCGR